jgi:CBS domain-containing membrane protein
MSDVVATLELGDTLKTAAEQMQAGRIRHLPVVDGQQRLVGLVSHRQVLSAWVSHGDPNHERVERIAGDVPIEALMERNVLTVTPDTTAAMAAALMESSKFGCLPVLDHGKLVGIITEADFVRFARKLFENEAA